MKRSLSILLAVLMVVSAFLMSGCMKEENYYTKNDIDGLVDNLMAEITSKTNEANEKIESLKPPMMPKAEEMVTASAAPAFTPIMLGEASLLARTFCITAPETARAIPHTKVARTLGKRT